MKKENLSDAINLINDDIIEQADTKRNMNKKYKVIRIVRVCVAACLALAISLTAITIIRNNFPSADNSTPPMPNNTTNSSAEQSTPDNTLNPTLPILDATMIFGDGGFEGYMLHDISELVNANPWNKECDIKTLPVYQNTLDAKEYFDIDADIEKMNFLIVDVAERFGLERDEIEITTDPHAYTKSLFVITNDFQIRVDPDLSATIKFEPTISLPDEYNFTYNNSTYNDMLAVAKYLQTEYSDIIDFENPQINITGGYYNIYNQQNYDIEFFNDSGDITQNIINYNFNRVAFYSNGENQLYMIRIYQPDLSQKIGDYPIITKEKAAELLSNGNFASSVPFDFPGVEYVKKVELVYRNAYWLDKIYMPYYKFYIELPERENWHGNGEKEYGAYYVPAVDGKYLKNMPVYDGRFN